MEMLKKQITPNNAWKPLRISPPERSHVFSTREKTISDVNESTSRDKRNRKVADVP